MRLKSLGLPKNAIAKLERLKESEHILEIEALHYSPKRIDKALANLDRRIKELVDDKNDIINSRQKPSSKKLKTIKRRLKTNRADQLKIITNFGLLAKLRKATQAVKEIETTLTETSDGVLELSKSD